MEKIYNRLLIILPSNSCIDEEKRNLEYFITLLLSAEDLIIVKEKWWELHTVLKQDSCFQKEINFNWLDLLSDKKGVLDYTPAEEFNPDINKYVETKIQHLTINNLGLEDGLAGLGYFLLKKDLKNL
ncbi:MAG: hypothetical protein LUH15_05060 [Tannerellaceae bacterium]|nr:hypothetical protein [Tannerellaceae bacterium]